MYDSLPNASVTIRVKDASIEDILNLVIVKLPGFALERIASGYYLTKSSGSVSKRNMDIFTISKINEKYSLNVQKATFASVIETLFRKAGKEYSSFARTNLQIENLSFKDKDFDDLLGLVLEQANCDYTIQGNIYYILEVQKKDLTKNYREIKVINLNNISCDSFLSVLPSELNSSAFIRTDKDANRVILYGTKVETEAIESFEVLLNTPVSLTPLFTAYEYDQKDRKIITTLPDGSIQNVSFSIINGNIITTSKDPLGNITKHTSDSRGNIIKTQKYDQQNNLLTEVSYKYNSIGEMIRAEDAAQNPVTIEYDWLGRKLSLQSPDSGRQEYKYDNCSNLIEETSSVLREKSQAIYYSYDGLNRLVKIEYPENETTTYTYGGYSEPNGAAGKIKTITDSSGTICYEYGKLGEITHEERTINTHLGSGGTETATMSYVSDYLGRMQSITSPDKETITYEYDAGGQVKGVKGNNPSYPNRPFVYVQNILYDKYGQRTKIVYGNGVTTTYEYDEARRWLSSIVTTDRDNNLLQNITYDFDKVGNVKEYVNDCLSENSGNYKTEQTYTYDSLYQLIKVDGTTEYNPYSSPEPEYVSHYVQDFSFDTKGLGNMTSKVSSENVSPMKIIGDDLNYHLVYNYSSEYAHRLINVGNRYYQYDANGMPVTS